MKHEFRIYQGCVLPKNIAPYVVIICQDAYQGSGFAALNSAYRGDDARALLNKYGKESQQQAWDKFQAGTGASANRPGTSTHEQKSDGRAFPLVPSGQDLPWWGLGLDIYTGNVLAAIRAARNHGWRLWQPYPGETWHVNFAREPKPGPRTWLRIKRIRAFLPRS